MSWYNSSWGSSRQFFWPTNILSNTSGTGCPKPISHQKLLQGTHDRQTQTTQSRALPPAPASQGCEQEETWAPTRLGAKRPLSSSGPDISCTAVAPSFKPKGKGEVTSAEAYSRLHAEFRLGQRPRNSEGNLKSFLFSFFVLYILAPKGKE